MSIALSDIVVNKAEDLEHAVTEILRQGLLSISTIVLRVGPRLWQSLTEGINGTAEADPTLDGYLNRILERAHDCDVHVLLDGHCTISGEKKLATLPPPHILYDHAAKRFAFRESPADVFDQLRELEFKKVFEQERHRCITCCDTNYHFELPSGAHASQFVRLGDAFADIAKVDRVAYWVAIACQAQRTTTLQAELPEESKEPEETPFAGLSESESSGESPDKSEKAIALVVDHPSMLVLAARVQALLPFTIDIVAFPEYPVDPEHVIASFDILNGIKSSCISAFVVIGVASTGRLANHIQSWGENHGAGYALQVAVLYSTQPIALKGSTKIMCSLDIPGYKHYAPGQACEFCLAHSQPVPIQSASYLVGHSPSEGAILGESFFGKQRAFFDQWGDIENALRVHYNDPNEPASKHHAFYIDVESLLKDQAFQAKLLAGIDTLPVPDVIVGPSLKVSKLLGRFISQARGWPFIELDLSKLGRGEPVDPTLYAAKCALVVDDVFSKGDRFTEINKYLREQGNLRAPQLEQVNYWTAIATLSSMTDYQKFHTGITKKNGGWNARLDHVFTVQMPDWTTEGDCPWCIEQRELRAMISAGADIFDENLNARLATLQGAGDGITEDPFFIPTGKQVPNLGDKSFFQAAGASPMRTLFACASGIQQLRDASTRQLDATRFPNPSYFAVRNFNKNYTEHLIWLTMLRSLKSKELEKALKQYLSEQALTKSVQSNSFIEHELAIAWITGKLGPIQLSNDAKEFFERLGVPWHALRRRGLVDSDPVNTSTTHGSSVASQADATEINGTNACPNDCSVPSRPPIPLPIQIIQCAVEFLDGLFKKPH